MKKILLALTVGTAACSFSALAAEGALTPTCQEYVKTVSQYLELAAQEPAMKDQVAALRQQNEQNISSLKKMPPDVQDTGCKAGMDAMAQMIKQAGGVK